MVSIHKAECCLCGRKDNENSVVWFWRHAIIRVYLSMILRRMRLFVLTFVIVLACGRIFAQAPAALDTVYLMSGKTVAGIVKDTTNEKLKILIPKSGGDYKADFIEQELVFSVKYKTGQESVFYVQDTLFGNYYTPNEIRYYLQGERDARASYRCRGWIVGGFIAGFAGGYTRSIFGFIPPFGYSAVSVGFRVKIRPGSVSNPDYLKYDTYLMGYEKVARQKRVMRTLLSGAIGFAAGFATNSIIYATQN